MAKGQPGAFRPINTLSETINPPNEYPKHKKSIHKSFSPQRSNIQKLSGGQSSPARSTTARRTRGEPSRKRLKTNTDHKVHSIPDSDSEDVAVTGYRSKSEPASPANGAGRLLELPLPQCRDGIALFSSRNEYRIVDERMNPRAGNGRHSSKRGSRSAADDSVLTSGRITEWKAPAQFPPDILPAGISDDIEDVADPANRQRTPNASRSRQKISDSRSLTMKPSGALDQLLDEASDSIKNEARDSRKARSRTPSNQILRDKFVRISKEDDTDELQMPSSPDHVLGQEPRGQKDQSQRNGAVTARGPEQKPHCDMPSSDIKPTVFGSSKSEATVFEASNTSSASLKQYDLEVFFSVTSNCTGDKASKVTLRSKPAALTLQSSRSKLPVDIQDISKVYLPDTSARRVHISCRSHRNRVTAWYHLVFRAAAAGWDFGANLLSLFSDGVSVTYKNETYLTELLEETQRLGVDQVENRLTAEKSSSKSLKKRQGDKKPATAKAARPHSTPESKPRQNRVASMRAEPEPVQKQSRCHRNREGIDELVYEIDETNEQERDPDPRGRPKQPTAGITTRATHRGQRLESTSPRRVEKTLKKYSKDPGLGPPWRKSLVYPRKGVNKATVEFDDLPRLDDNEFLNDNLVAFCLKYAQQLSLESARRVYMFNTFFYEKLTQGVPRGKKINYEAVKRWTAKARLFEGDWDHIIVPINEDFHWYAAIICNVPNIPKKININEENTIESPAKSDAVVSSPDGPLLIGKPHEKKSRALDAELALETDHMSLDDHEERTELSDKKFPVDGGRDETVLARNKRGDETERVPKDSKSKKRKSGGGGKRKRTPEEPVILVLDSLTGGHPTLTRNLKDYLSAEAQDKISSEVEEPLSSFERDVPGQKNFSDCGLYLVGYISRFLEDPEGFLANAASNELALDPAWKRLDTSRMRHNIRSVLMNEYAEQLKEQPVKGVTGGEEIESQKRRQLPPRPPGTSAYEQFTAPTKKPVATEKKPPVEQQVQFVDDSEQDGKSDTARRANSPELYFTTSQVKQANTARSESSMKSSKEHRQQILGLVVQDSVSAPFERGSPNNYEKERTSKGDFLEQMDSPLKRKRRLPEPESRPPIWGKTTKLQSHDTKNRTADEEPRDFTDAWYEQLRDAAELEGKDDEFHEDGSKDSCLRNDTLYDKRDGEEIFEGFPDDDSKPAQEAVPVVGMGAGRDMGPAEQGRTEDIAVKTKLAVAKINDQNSSLKETERPRTRGKR